MHLILAAAAPLSPNDDRQWERYQELLPHVTSEATEMAQCRDPKVRAFALDMLRYLYQSSSLTSCDELAQTFIEQWLGDSGPDDPDVLEAQRIRGNVLRQLGSYESVRNHGADPGALPRRARRTSPSDGRDPDVVRGRPAHEGNFAAALDMDRDTFESHEAAFGMADPQSMRALHNLALDYGLNSEYAEAVKRFKRAYQLESEAREGISAAEVLTAWYGLAWAVRLQGEVLRRARPGPGGLGLRQGAPGIRPFRHVAHGYRPVGLAPPHRARPARTRCGSARKSSRSRAASSRTATRTPWRRRST